MSPLDKALKHKPPFFDHSEKNTSLSYCLKCCTVAAREDLKSTKPCPDCGGTVTSHNLYGQWQRSSGGWFRPEVGEWCLTPSTRILLTLRYNEHHNRSQARTLALVEPRTFYDLDFTKK